MAHLHASSARRLQGPCECLCADPPQLVQASMSAATVPALTLHWQCMQAAALQEGAGMVRKAFQGLLFVLAYLLGLVGGLAWRVVQVFVGTYQSSACKVRRAGAVADLNATVLAAAAILLWTSRNAFSDAQAWTLRQAWLSQLQELPVVACSTFSQEHFEGTISHGLTFHCDKPGHRSNDSALVLNTDVKQVNVNQTLQVLEILNGCGAFSMAFQVLRQGDHSQLVRHIGNESIASALKNITVQFHAPDAGGDKYYLDEIKSATNTCTAPSHEGSGGSSGPDGVTRGAGQCPDDVAFAANTRILRYLTIKHNNVGLFLNYKCDQRDVDACFSQSVARQSLDVTGLGLVSGEGAFCPLNGNLSITWNDQDPYHCAEGFDVSQNLDAQRAKVDGLRLIYKFMYFYPVSYEELFGLYIALAGVFVTVCLGTGVLLFTDVVCPMFKCGRESWRASLPRWLQLPASAAALPLGHPGGGNESHPSPNGVAVAAKQGFLVWQIDFCCKDLVEIVLRCTVSLLLGTILSVVCVLVPLLASQDGKGSCGHLDPPQSSVFICTS